MRFETVTQTSLLLIPDASDSVSGFWYQQVPDFEELAFALHLLGPGDLFVDVGANQGGWSLIAAGRGCRAIAFEPIPETFCRLQSNFAANAREIQGRLQLVNCGLSDVEQIATFTSDLDVGNHVIRDGSAPKTPVVEARLCRADDKLSDEAPTLIKIDVEGEELRVLKGAQRTLSKPSLLAIVMETFRPENYGTHSLIESEAILNANGFLPVAYDPWTRTMAPLRSPEQGSQNTIYIRSSPEVLSRIRKAPSIAAFGRRI